MSESRGSGWGRGGPAEFPRCDPWWNYVGPGGREEGGIWAQRPPVVGPGKPRGRLHVVPACPSAPARAPGSSRDEAPRIQLTFC